MATARARALSTQRPSWRHLLHGSNPCDAAPERRASGTDIGRGKGGADMTSYTPSAFIRSNPDGRRASRRCTAPVRVDHFQGQGEYWQGLRHRRNRRRRARRQTEGSSSRIRLQLVDPQLGDLLSVKSSPARGRPSAPRRSRRDIRSPSRVSQCSAEQSARGAGLADATASRVLAMQRHRARQAVGLGFQPQRSEPRVERPSDSASLYRPPGRHHPR